MFKDKIELLTKSLDEVPNKKKIENMLVILLLLIITTVAINVIWNEDEEEEETTNKELVKTEEINNMQIANTQNIDEEQTSKKELETSLENILSKIVGVGNVSVFINYSTSNEMIPIYDESLNTSSTEETDTEGATRVISQEEIQKEVIYQDENGEKKLVTQKVINAKIEGAIVTAVGAGNAVTRSNIIQAVEAVTGLATHKIQVFEEHE